jgi:glucose-6-phosphate isomerase
MRLNEKSAWQTFRQAVESARPDAGALRLIDAADLQVDLSTQRDSPDLRASAQALLDCVGFDAKRQSLFDGGLVNQTEGRPALHTALRGSYAPVEINQQIQKELLRMKAFVDEANTSNRYRNIVHLGIGGSDWGPRMVWNALRGADNRRDLRFAANIDAHAIDAALSGLDPKDTLLVIASKSFTTIESITNARHAISWMRTAGIKDPLKQTIALTASTKAALEFGIAPAHIFPFWDWVGGRYSVWSSIGLSIALSLGWKTFADLLAGAAAMDAHFLTAPVSENAPVQLALNTVANTSVLGYHSEVVCPYDARLADFVPWLQQLQMESLGKSVTLEGEPLDIDISPAVWGMPGTDSQHTFFQWLHQGQTGAPVDFIACLKPAHKNARNHQQLLINCLAQRAALLRGKGLDEALSEVQQTKADPTQELQLAKHRTHPGGRPSTLIILPELDARRLGALLALYEHKVFTAGAIWGINPFDQWGVEFGKGLARQLLGNDPEQIAQFDVSTRFWVQRLARTGET